MNAKNEKLIFLAKIVVIFKYEALNRMEHKEVMMIKKEARSRSFRGNFSKLNDIWRTGTFSLLLRDLTKSLLLKINVRRKFSTLATFQCMLFQQKREHNFHSCDFKVELLKLCSINLWPLCEHSKNR